eukprot:1140451-Pelagomonas_calceolata.AAC.2
MQFSKPSHECVLHHPMAGRGAKVLPTQAKIESQILTHHDHLNPRTRPGMGSIRGQAAIGVC